MIQPVTVIVLAAGRGSRLPGAALGPQPALEGGGEGGSSLLSATLRNAIASRLPVVVVTTADLAPQVQQQVAARDVLVVPPQPRGRSLGDAIAAAVSARADASGWLLLPAEMPRILPATLQQVAQALQTHAVAYAQYRGRRGHPVGFAAELFSELVALTGDEGARRLVDRYAARAVEVDDPGALADIDTLQDPAVLRSVTGGSALNGGVLLQR